MKTVTAAIGMSVSGNFVKTRSMSVMKTRKGKVSTFPSYLISTKTFTKTRKEFHNLIDNIIDVNLDVDKQPISERPKVSKDMKVVAFSIGLRGETKKRNFECRNNKIGVLKVKNKKGKTTRIPTFVIGGSNSRIRKELHGLANDVINQTIKLKRQYKANPKKYKEESKRMDELNKLYKTDRKKHDEEIKRLSRIAHKRYKTHLAKLYKKDPKLFREETKHMNKSTRKRMQKSIVNF